MSNIKLNQMTIESFKGLKYFLLDFADGDSVIIKGENGIGKTTIFDAFLWLFFDKDSTGRADFEVRPLDKNKQPLKGLVVAVESALDIDGDVHTFRKEQHERIVKNQLKGYEILCWIDEVPKKVGEFKEYIAEIISEEIFKLLTNLRYFCEDEKRGGIHWSKRRGILLDLAGDIGTPIGFDKLLAVLNGRSLDDFKSVLAEQKKRLTKERDEINPRIDELQRGLAEYADTNAAELNEKRKAIKLELGTLDVMRHKITKQETERQTKLDHFNNLKAKKLLRESELVSDTSGVKILLDEKIQIEIGIEQIKELVAKDESELKIAEIGLLNSKNELSSLMATLNNIRAEYNIASETPKNTVCYACGQQLPTDKLAENEDRRKARLDEITERGNKFKQTIDERKKILVGLENSLKKFQSQVESSKAKLIQIKDISIKHLAEIKEDIDNRDTLPPEKDEVWQKICAEITKAEKAIGKPVSEQLQAIDTERSGKAGELAEFDKALAQADRMKQDKCRIAELESEEKKLAQQIADIERKLDEIKQYKLVESDMLTEVVNKKFKHVKFKLFDELLNGEIDDRVCEAIYNGVPYPDMSAGQQIYCGIDIINILSEHYDLSVPLFIDHSESMTLPIEATGQVIELYAQKGVKKLQVQKIESTKKIVA